MADYMDALANLGRIHDFRLHRRRLVDPINPFELYTEEEFTRRFRFSWQSVIELVNLVREDIAHVNLNNSHVPAHVQMLIALRFYVTGSYQQVVGDVVNIHQTTAGRIVNRVTNAIARRHQQFISFPSNQEVRAVKESFYGISRFPGIVGAIDCTHIPVTVGVRNAELFRNRKGYFSINTQVIGGPNYEIYNLVARWSGSTHDSRILDNSNIGMRFENQEINGILLGENGYPCRNYLLTPILQPNTREERRYNHSQIGIWKRRFSCIRGLRSSMERNLKRIIATACLHNYATRRNEEVPNDDEDNQEEMVQPLEAFYPA